MSAIIELKDVTKRFPGVVANDGVNLTVEEGTVHAILGENGAGKSTLVKTIYGLHRQDEGTIRIDGEQVTFDSPRDAIDCGIGMIHQHFMLVDTLSVAQNVTLGHEPRGSFGLSTDIDAARDAVKELADRYGFEIDPDERVEDISIGERQRVEILKTLYRGADVLILDEPTAVLTPQEVEGLFEVMNELTSRGKTLIFITHKLGEVMRIASTVSVLRDGKNVGTVSVEETTRDELATLMVGRSVLLDVETSNDEPGEEVFVGDDLTVLEDGRPVVDEVSFSVQEGEVLGIAGVDGNGQSELAEVIGGLRSASSGQLVLQGDDITETSRRERIERGIAHIPEDRQHRGVIMDFDLAENALLGRQFDLNFGSRNRDEALAREIIDEYDVAAPGPNVSAKSLSGGNQQKFIIGRELRREPPFILAVHPTRGLDVGSIEFIHDRLLEFRDDGAGVLLISSKLDELQQLSDRLAVMYEGKIVAIVDPDDVTEQELGLLMAGEELEGSNSE